MKTKGSFVESTTLLAALVFLLSISAGAQGTSGAQAGAAPEEHRAGNYIVSQSVEFGFRYTDVSGAQYACPAGTADRSSAGLCQDQSMYNTFVNLHTGPRLLEQTLSLRSPGHTGVLFDDMYLSSFGFGGDPNSVARLRLKKFRAYNLNVTFRRDQNFFNYNLLANPLNPPVGPVTTNTPVLNPSPPAIPGSTVGVPLIPGGNTAFLVGNSPHWFTTARRMTDVDLTIAPQSVISLRLGYSRNRVEGNSSYSFHMPRGTDIATTMNNDNTSDQYRAGLDFRFIPNTTISYDQFYTHNRMNLVDDDLNLYWLTGATPVDFGVSWNVAANQPCRGTSVFTAACNQAAFFTRQNRYRSSIPTEQLSLQSQFGRIDLSGRFTYSHAHMDGTYSHFWNGVTNTGRQQLFQTAPQNRRDAAEANIGATVRITDKLRIKDYFRWFNWRIPSRSLVATTTWGPGAAPLTTPLGTPTTAGVLFDAFWKEERKENEVQIEYDFVRAFGARVGYRYTKRFLFITGESADVSPENVEVQPGDFEGEIDEARQPIHTALFGFWIRPSEKFRFNADAEMSSAGITVGVGPIGETVTTLGVGNLTRITPRHELQYRVRANYNPQRWMTVAATVNVLQANNRLVADDYQMHNRNFGMSAMLMPNDRYTLDFSYNFNNYLQNNLICGAGTYAVGSGPINPVCPFDISPTTGLPTGLYQVFGRYENISHFVSVLGRWKPVPRVSVGLGYSIVNSDGAETFLNPLLVPGTLKNSFHRPLASIEVELVKNWFAKAGWNYYGYNEKGASGPTQPRDFHANSGMVSLKYAF